ncbi:AEC family transporter [Polycladidibacter hongkongensis]|uniref:AEC family transporter n=1 Tax=Polycladidibacter hongkongensis TaxID=1647556 RepID=UPI0008343B9F|nr:AEC family transporter [Pseudovibrio hongkongensis]
MLEVLNLALPFFLIIFLGYGSGRLGPHPQDGLAWMSFFVVYLALPALFFQLLSATPIEELTNFTFIAATTLSTFTVFVLAFFVGVLASQGRMDEATIQGLVGSYSNIGFMGPGVTLAVLGEAAAVPTALILCFDTILLFILVPLMMSISGTRDQSPLKVAGQIALDIITHPFIIAVGAGIMAAVLGFKPPQAINQLLEFLRAAAAPCALFAMGITIALQPGRRGTVELPFLLVLKLVVHPLLVYNVLHWIGVTNTQWIATAVLMAALPPAANVFILAQHYDTYKDRASTAVLVGTLLSVVSLPVFIYLIEQGRL